MRCFKYELGRKRCFAWLTTHFSSASQILCAQVATSLVKALSESKWSVQCLDVSLSAAPIPEMDTSSEAARILESYSLIMQAQNAELKAAEPELTPAIRQLCAARLIACVDSANKAAQAQQVET